MTTDRLDDLIEEALASGAVPPGASESEQREIEAALSASARLGESAARARIEADTSRPRASVRFAAYVEARGEGPRWWRRVTPMRAGVVALPLAVAAVAVFIAVLVTGGEGGHSVSALAPGDYVQVEGEVAEATHPSAGVVRIRLATAIGLLDLDIDDSTRFLPDNDLTAATIAPGDRLLLSGIATSDVGVAASTLARLSDGAAVDRPIGRVGNDVRAVSGRLVALVVSDTERAGKAVLESNDGRRLLVPLGLEALRRLYAADELPIGASLDFVRSSDGTRFELDRLAPATRPRRDLPSVSGLVTGAANGVLSLETDAGLTVPVSLSRTTRFVVEPGLLREAPRPRGRGDDAVGLTIRAFGSRNGTGGFIADLVVVLAVERSQPQPDSRDTAPGNGAIRTGYSTVTVFARLRG